VYAGVISTILAYGGTALAGDVHTLHGWNSSSGVIDKKLELAPFNKGDDAVSQYNKLERQLITVYMRSGNSSFPGFNGYFITGEGHAVVPWHGFKIDQEIIFQGMGNIPSIDHYYVRDSRGGEYKFNKSGHYCADPGKDIAIVRVKVPAPLPVGPLQYKDAAPDNSVWMVKGAARTERGGIVTELLVREEVSSASIPEKRFTIENTFRTTIDGWAGDSGSVIYSLGPEQNFIAGMVSYGTTGTGAEGRDERRNLGASSAKNIVDVIKKCLQNYPGIAHLEK
jgi:hypothetical protein